LCFVDTEKAFDDFRKIKHCAISVQCRVLAYSGSGSTEMVRAKPGCLEMENERIAAKSRGGASRVQGRASQVHGRSKAESFLKIRIHFCPILMNK